MSRGIGAAAVVWRNGRLLLGHRAGSHGHGTWGLPGGKVEPDESPAVSVRRELAEETGLAGEVIDYLGSVDVIIEGRQWQTEYYLLEADGEPVMMEPNKFFAWRWCDPTDLPSPLFAPLAAYLALTPLVDPASGARTVLPN
jgi:8-oxo-dGTP diphosphatase